MRNGISKKIALGGLLAALAVVIMTLVGMIPIATYVCPMLCMILCYVVSHICGKRIGWAWYGAVSFLSCILAPDKEAAAVFVFLGYYPIIKPFFEWVKFGIVLKFAYFNASVVVLYYLLIRFLGMDQILSEFMEFGYIGLAFTLLLGNVVFVLSDMVLTLISKRFRWR